jgi:hypothetical protein
MSTSPPEFTTARACFNTAYFILIVRLGWWATMEQGEEGLSPGPSVAFLLAILLSGLWIRTMSWVDARQAIFVDTNNIRIRHREQREVLTRFIEKGTQFRETYKSLDPIPRTVAQEWETEVYMYLEKTLGHDYAVQFRRPNVPFLPNLRPSNISEENYKLYLYFNLRLARLDEFITGLKD